FGLPDRLGHQKQRSYAEAIAQGAVCLFDESLQLIAGASLHRGEGVCRLGDIAWRIGRKSHAPQELASLSCEQLLREQASDTVTVGRHHSRRCRRSPVRCRDLLRRKALRASLSALAKPIDQ